MAASPAASTVRGLGTDVVVEACSLCMYTHSSWGPPPAFSGSTPYGRAASLKYGGKMPRISLPSQVIVRSDLW